MNPAKGHHRLLNLHLEKFYFINHRTLVIRSSLLWENQRCGVELASAFFASQNRASFYLFAGVFIGLPAEFGNDLDWQVNTAQIRLRRLG
jgi:hypothetical protein